MAEELKPCPFCGGKGIDIIRNDEKENSYYCITCCAEGPTPGDGYDWNTRSPAPVVIGYTREQMKAAHTEGVLLAQQSEVFKKTEGRRQISRLEAEPFINSLPTPGELPSEEDAIDWCQERGIVIECTTPEFKELVSYMQTPVKK